MVSRAFTPGASVSPEARAKVVEAARRLNYRPSLIARSLITQQSQLIAVAIAYLENQFYPIILQTLSECFAAQGYRVLLFTPGPDGDPDPILDEVLRFQVAAVVLASTRMTSRFAEECAHARIPVVLLNRRTETSAVCSVTGQNVSGGRIVGSFLIAGGHARFAYLAGVEDSSLDHKPFNASLGGKVVVRPMGLLTKLPILPSRQRIRLAVLAYLAADFPLALSTSVSNVFRASRAAAFSGSRIHSRPNKARV